jgi:glycerol-3-phosphate dehydrogenase (NAD(P)+)
MKIAILGGGSWGTALAMHFAKKNYEVKVWEFVAEQAQKMQNERTCPLLPEIKLPENIKVSSKMENVLLNAELVLVAVPSDHVEKTVDNAASLLVDQPIIICSKGFASNLRLLSNVVKEKVKGEVYCLYGPTHAEEVCKGVISGIVLAGGPGREELKPIIESNYLHVDLTDDFVGVQVAAALKNILAIYLGLADGLGLGDNTKAYLITHGLAEIKDVGLAWGAKEDTFYGLAGLGDVIVTCNSKHSRNRHVGEQLAKGLSLEEITDEMKMVAEGVNTLKTAIKLRERFALKLPLISALHEVLFEGKDPKEIITKF